MLCVPGNVDHVYSVQFCSLVIDGVELLVDEKNLLYVAVTRAKKQVIINRDILRLLATANEHFMNLMTNCITEVSPHILL